MSGCEKGLWRDYESQHEKGLWRDYESQHGKAVEIQHESHGVRGAVSTMHVSWKVGGSFGEHVLLGPMPEKQSCE